MKLKNNKQTGMSLLEILVVVTIFAVLGVLVTRSVLLTLQGSRKTEALVKTRENLNFAMSVMERQIRNADSIIQCPNADPKILDYTDADGATTSFTCTNIATADGYIASGSARLTNDSINVLTCQFGCTIGSSTNPSSVTIDISATDKTATGVQNATVSVSNKIYLRNY